MKNENFTCKNCGGMMKYDPKSQNLKCENCGNEIELPKKISLVRHVLSQYEYNLKKIPEEKTTVIQCESCGATIELSSEKSSANCPYCGSNIVVSEKIMSILEPDGLRPFLIEQKEVKMIFSNWIKKRWFAPNALKNLYQTGKIMGISQNITAYQTLQSISHHIFCLFISISHRNFKNFRTKSCQIS